MDTALPDNDERLVDQLIKQYDQTAMPIPDIECEPHLLISKVRKHYMEYLIKLLSVNYETNQKLVNKNIYLPSAIWRCAKHIETAAAQACMVVELYRKSIVAVVKQLKNDTKRGKLNKKLYECLHKAPENEKILQTTLNVEKNCDCICTCQLKKKRRKASNSPKISHEVNDNYISQGSIEVKNGNTNEYTNKIPVLINSLVETPKEIENARNMFSAAISKNEPSRLSVESQESDDLMSQLEKLFQDDPNDDDLFDGALCDTMQSITNDDNLKKSQKESHNGIDSCAGNKQVDNSIIENQAIQIKSLDERLTSLAGLLANNNDNNTDSNTALSNSNTAKTRKKYSSKWLCEEYFLKTRLFELLDEVGESNRRKLSRIKEMLLELFGDDSDDEGVASPLEETPDFIISCKERIAPWVVKLLTPYYIKGRIRGKALFKALAKHLIRLIYQCSRYPREKEVCNFVTDFLENHKMIRCEADFKEFRIENI